MDQLLLAFVSKSLLIFLLEKNKIDLKTNNNNNNFPLFIDLQISKICFICFSWTVYEGLHFMTGLNM